MPKCPECGFVYPKKERRMMKEVNGNLVEITPEMAEKLNERKLLAKQQGSAQTMEDLIELATLRDYKSPRTWAHHVYNARRRAHV